MSVATKLSKQVDVNIRDYSNKPDGVVPANDISSRGHLQQTELFVSVKGKSANPANPK